MFSSSPEIQTQPRVSPRLIQVLIDTHRGLGAVICDKFASEGCNVAINYVSSKDAADKFAGEIKSKHGVNAITLAGVSTA